MSAPHHTYLTLAETADYLRLSRDTVRAAIYDGRLVAKKSGKGGGGRVLVRQSDADAFFESLEDAS